jgi:NADH:ubiquinone oxidoreductase subunit H
MNALAALNWLASAMPETSPGVMRLVDEVLALVNWLGVEGGLDTHGWWIALLLPLVAILILLGPIITIFPMFAIWLERKVSAHMQSRLGPMEIGWHGFLQTVADGVKLLAKEDVIPRDADKPLFILGPIFAFTGVFLFIAVLPFGPYLSVSDMPLGIVFLAAVGSVEVVGVLMAGWASNNKWALFGTMRVVTQLVSYEIPLGLCFLSVVVVSGSMQLSEINGSWEAARYVRLDDNGARVKDTDGVVIAYDAKEVDHNRAAYAEEAYESFGRDVFKATRERFVNELGSKFAFVEGDAIGAWRELFTTREDLPRTKRDESTLYFDAKGDESVSQARAQELAGKALVAVIERDGTLDKRVEELQRFRFEKAYGAGLVAEGRQGGQSGWLWNWYVFRNPFMAIICLIFFIASLAENKRAPFDLPEAESELVSGFHTEYSGMRFSIFFLAEYVAMFVASLLISVMFLGGWNTGIEFLDNIHVVADPVLEGSKIIAPALSVPMILHVLIGHVTIVLKTLFFVFVQMWLRWTLPRVRLDHVMDLCLKVLLPFSLVGLVLVAVWELMLATWPALHAARVLFCGLGCGAVVAWAYWFWFSFQAPLASSMKSLKWDSSGAFLRSKP